MHSLPGTAIDMASRHTSGKPLLSQISRKLRRSALARVAPSLLTRPSGYKMLASEKAYYSQTYTGRTALFGCILQKLHWTLGNVMMAKDMAHRMPVAMALDVAGQMGCDYRARNRRLEALLKSPWVRLEGEDLVFTHWHINHGGEPAAQERRAARLGARRERDNRLRWSVERQKKPVVTGTYEDTSLKHRSSPRSGRDKHRERDGCWAHAPVSRPRPPAAGLTGLDGDLAALIAKAQAASQARAEAVPISVPKLPTLPSEARKPPPQRRGSGVRRKVPQKGIVTHDWWEDAVRHRAGYERCNIGPFRRERADIAVVLFAMGCIEGATTTIKNRPGALLNAVRELQAGRWVMPAAG